MVLHVFLISEFENMLKYYYEVLGVSYDHVMYIQNLLHRLIDLYTPKTPNVVQPKTSGASKFNSTISGYLMKKQNVGISTISFHTYTATPICSTTMVRKSFLITKS